MMLRKVFISLVVALMLISTMPTQTFSQSSSPKKWTLIIYLDADNNLEEYGIKDLNELEAVGSTNEVNVVVQFDRIDEYDTSNGDWKGAKRYYIIKDEDPTAINSIEIEDLGEVNMGDPNTLIDFVIWGIQNYPAEHYLIDFWDHGGSWQGVCWDDTDNEDYLTLPEIEEVLHRIRLEINKNIDIALFDACNMGNTEVFYQIRKYVDIAVGSEASVPGDGCPYNKILEFLMSNTATAPEELAAKIVELYIKSYSDHESDPDDTPTATMSAFKLKGFDELTEIADELCALLSKKAGTPLEGGYNFAIVDSRNGAETFVTPSISPFLDLIPNLLTSLIDLYDFAFEVQNNFRISSEAKNKANELMASWETLRIASGEAGGFPDAHGLTIYFPNDWTTEYQERYEEVAFAEDKYWNEFIHHVNSREGAKDTPPTCLILEPSVWEIINSEYYQIKGIAFDAESLQNVQIKIDNSEWQTAEGAEGWSYNWRTSSGKHKIYARSSDGTQYSTEFEIEVEVPAKKGGAAPMTFWILIGIAVAFAAIIFLLAIKKLRKKSLSGKLLTY